MGATLPSPVITRDALERGVVLPHLPLQDAEQFRSTCFHLPRTPFNRLCNCQRLPGTAFPTASTRFCTNNPPASRGPSRIRPTRVLQTSAALRSGNHRLPETVPSTFPGHFWACGPITHPTQRRPFRTAAPWGHCSVAVLPRGQRGTRNGGCDARGPQGGVWGAISPCCPLSPAPGVDIIVTTLPGWGWGWGGALSREAVMTE